MAIYSDFAVEDGITGQLFLCTHEVHPSSAVGIDARHRGQRVMNGLVILHRHCGQKRVSSFNCSSSVRCIFLNLNIQITNNKSRCTGSRKAGQVPILKRFKF
jgi:hypothetical protein